MIIFSPNELKINLEIAIGKEAFSEWEQEMNIELPDNIEGLKVRYAEEAPPLFAKLSLASECQRPDLVEKSVVRAFAAMHDVYTEYQDITLFKKPTGPLNEAQIKFLEKVGYVVYGWRYSKNCGFLLDGVLACFCDEVDEDTE